MATTGAAPRGRLVALCQHLTLPVGSVDGGATAAESSSGGRVEVPTHCGPVRGIDRGATHAFFGIPYATAERWRAPRTPPAPWSGVRDASKIGAACPQSVPHPVPGFAASGPQDEESCLNLNIFCPCPSPLTTGPAPSAAAAAPVLLWIHGGGFTHGAAYEPLYDGGVLAAQGAVVVSANWRLGALGFGFLGELGDQYSANNGLLDIIAALTWIRDNISQFGGDPQCVTVFGESAGAFAVFSLLAMPTAVGLFHRAICQSGGGSALQPTAEMGAAGMRQLLSLVEPGEGGAASSLEYLLDCPVEEIIAAQGKMAGLSGNIFAPTVEARTMPRQPLGAIAAGSAKGVPLLLGTNRDEPKLFVAARGRPELDEGSLLVRVQACLGLPRDENGAQRAAAVVEAFREARGVAGRATPGTPKNVDLCDAIGAEMWHGSCRNLALAQAAHAPTFVYLFSFESPAMRGLLGAAHALEIPFVFGTFNSAAVDPSDQAAAPDAVPRPRISRFAGSGPDVEALGAQMQHTWLTFARTGTPPPAPPRSSAAEGGGCAGGGGGDVWRSYDEQTRPTMVFDGGSRSRLVSDPMAIERQSVDAAIGAARHGATLGL